MKCRAYNDPNPDKRAMLDCVSNFIDAINRRLRAGRVRNTKFTVEFRTDVFKQGKERLGTTLLTAGLRQ